MAVFTPVSEQDARALLAHYDLGELISLRGITAGIENTNFFLHTTRGEYVLTLFEVLTQEQLPFYIELMHHLASRGIPVPQPQTLKDGTRLTTLHGKPTAIVSRLPGGYEPAPGPRHCALAGATLARTHLAGQDYPLQQPNLRGLPWWEQTAPKVLPFLTPEQATLLQSELQAQQTAAASPLWPQLPSGPAHCDLFRDNVLFAGTFDDPLMGGFIDFYFAGCDSWLFDVAVSVNDWCIVRETGEFVPELVEAWLAAYAAERPFTDAEREAWPTMLRAAALRFWLSRLFDFFLPRPAQTLKPHDPRHFERVLQARHRSALPVLP
ncbi:homoserine kinase [Bordetella genomosp. 1]|uniref:Homoserine kinase n=1 Tax=Bordetella genomosp. 1 TaxID=1395607 RepID=A0ABX4EU87_9BORD|nr:homoserine kinase [Bordetella genomosp. 1]MDQ8033125.1 homoserine kinase [Bordetella sp.]OZI57805.1 homoserine kinase [Bordetella genomosp. 1]